MRTIDCRRAFYTDMCKGRTSSGIHLAQMARGTKTRSSGCVPKKSRQRGENNHLWAAVPDSKHWDMD